MDLKSADAMAWIISSSSPKKITCLSASGAWGVSTYHAIIQLVVLPIFQHTVYIISPIRHGSRASGHPWGRTMTWLPGRLKITL